MSLSILLLDWDQPEAPGRGALLDDSLLEPQVELLPEILFFHWVDRHSFQAYGWHVLGMYGVLDPVGLSILVIVAEDVIVTRLSGVRLDFTLT